MIRQQLPQKSGLQRPGARWTLLAIVGIPAGPIGVVILVLAFTATNEPARPWLLALAALLWIVVIGGVGALCLQRKRGRTGARHSHGQHEVRANRVLGREDYLLIRTTGVVAVFHASGDSAPLRIEETVSSELRPGELVLIEAGQVVPCDGEIVEGAAAIDEAAVTGVSWPVFREAGGPHSSVLGGTLVISGRLIVRVTP
jgi:high-affinity K+ transport system ATPase subunit B